MEMRSDALPSPLGDDAATLPAEALAAASAQRWDRKVDTAIVLLLAVASLLAAWGGYQAGLWSEKKSGQIIAAEASQIEATRATTIGYQVMQIDIAVFLNWLNADKGGNAALATFYQDRFSPQLQAAFAAWMATDPFANPDAPTDPFRLPEYKVPQLLAAAAFDEDVHRAYGEAEQTGSISDAYVLTTLLLAVVLFFGGICTKIGWRPAQLALLGLAVLLLLYAVWNIGALPDGSDWDLTPLWGRPSPFAASIPATPDHP
ncbi:MAG: hypothetical protein IT338_19560 [Thermomicrobiales bacterium]|nr:hypothetical protein [Thermomicrobiales bacterium]